MKKEKLRKLSDNELLLLQKKLKTITTLLALVLIILFITSIYVNISNQINSLLLITPLALIPIVVINTNYLKNIKQEKENRKLE